ncbi:MAG: hypothetical protein WAV05_09805 [Anaerolineales bacterium]
MRYIGLDLALTTAHKAVVLDEKVVWCKYSVRPERTKDYLINPKVLPKKFDG